jgi:hypothetical protein
MTVWIPNAFAILNIYTTGYPHATPGNEYDINTTTQGTVEYTIGHYGNSNVALNYYQLYFDPATFTNFTLLGVYSNTGANLSSLFDFDSNFIWSIGNLNLAPGASIILQVSYTLPGGASTLSWNNEGGPWQQGFVGQGSGGPSGFSGGSSSLAPEPGTIMLLGSGLLGLGLVRRYLRRPKRQ